MKFDRPVTDLAEREDFKSLYTLLKEGLDINAKQEYYGNTLLHIATWHNKVNLAAFLLYHNAETNTRNYDSNTPLHFASMLYHKDLVELLLAHNANITLKNIYGKTAFNMAQGNAYFNNKDSIAHMLAGKLEKPHNQKLLEAAIVNGNYWVVKLLTLKNITLTIDHLVLAKKCHSLAKNKAPYKAIGRLLVSYLRLIGELRVQQYSYLKKLMVKFHKVKSHRLGPLSKNGIIGCYGLSQYLADTIARMVMQDY